MRDLIVVDDDPFIHRIINECARKFPNLRVEGSLDGLSIIEYLSFYREIPDYLPDFILLDLDMPEFSGWDFLDKFRYIRPRLAKNVGLYILTGLNNPLENLQSSSYPNVRGIFHKPFSSHILKTFED